MSTRTGTVISGAAAAAAVTVVVLIVIDGSGPADPAGTERSLSVPGSHPRGGRMDCSTRSEADFPGAFTDPRNLVIGPLVLVGGAAVAHDPVSVIRQYHGQKLPILVKAGHTVTLRIARRARALAGLGYTPEGRVLATQVGLRNTHPAVTFTACRRGERSGSQAGAAPVTFWSGAVVVTRAPACVPLEAYVGDEPSPRRVVLSMAAGRCEARPQAAVATPPLRDCRSRAEGDRPPDMASGPRDVVVGPLAFAGWGTRKAGAGSSPTAWAACIS